MVDFPVWELCATLSEEKAEDIVQLCVLCNICNVLCVIESISSCGFVCCSCVQLPRETLRSLSRCLIWTAMERWTWRSLNRLDWHQQHVLLAADARKPAQNQHIKRDRSLEELAHIFILRFNNQSSFWLFYSDTHWLAIKVGSHTAVHQCDPFSKGTIDAVLSSLC